MIHFALVDEINGLSIRSLEIYGRDQLSTIFKSENELTARPHHQAHQ